jgi:hypothetical protein
MELNQLMARCEMAIAESKQLCMASEGLIAGALKKIDRQKNSVKRQTVATEHQVSSGPQKISN